MPTLRFLFGGLLLFIAAAGCQKGQLIEEGPARMNIHFGDLRSLDTGGGNILQWAMVGAGEHEWLVVFTSEKQEDGNLSDWRFRLQLRCLPLMDGHVGPAETIWEKENAPSGDTLSFATAALVADGPLVIWLAQAEGNLEYSRRQATGWTKPQPIGGTTARQTGRRYIAAVVDESGVLHCLYAGRLQPPEDYTTGILDGYFPLKLFVTVLDGDKWSNPQCLMSRSRVSTSEIAAIRCGDRVCVLAAIREEAPLGGKSERMGFLATKPSLSDWVYFDDTNRLVLYRDISLARDDAGRFYAAYQASDSTNRPVGSRARIMAFDDGLTWRTARLADEKADYSLVANDASGTVFVYSEVDERGFISARNGREHSVTVSIGDVPRWAKRAFQCIGGGIYLSWVDPASPNRLVVQKIEARTGR